MLLGSSRRFAHEGFCVDCCCRRISLIAGGTGITPCWQIIRTVTDDPEDETQVGGAVSTAQLRCHNYSATCCMLCAQSEQATVMFALVRVLAAVACVHVWETRRAMSLANSCPSTPLYYLLPRCLCCMPTNVRTTSCCGSSWRSWQQSTPTSSSGTHWTGKGRSQERPTWSVVCWCWHQNGCVLTWVVRELCIPCHQSCTV